MSNRIPVSVMCTIEEVREVQPNTCVEGSARTPMSAMCTEEEVGGVQSNTCVGHVYCTGALMGSIEHLYRPFVLQRSLDGVNRTPVSAICTAEEP